MYEELSKLQWRPTEELLDRQYHGLRAILEFAYENVPLYRRRMKACNIRPGDFRSLDDLSRLPIVSKDEIRTGFPNDVVSSGWDFRSGIASFTSGSTQTPFYVYLDPSIRGITLATRMFFDSWVGVTLVDRHLEIGRRFPKIRDRIFLNELQIPALDTSSETLEEVFERIRAFHPAALSGHPSSLVMIAIHILENFLEGTIRPKAICPWGETLLPQYRATLEKAFQSPVLARYGAAETGGYLAQECPDGCSGYHVNTELGVLEVVDANGSPVLPGERGRVIVTNLRNRLMPFIRYDIGDLAVQGDIPKCGRGLPLVKSIEGRAADLVETRTGSMRPVISFYIPPRFWRSVWRYQFVQNRPGHLKVLVVPSSEFNAEIRDEILTSFQAMASDVEFEISVVSEIIAEKSGKTPLLIRRN